MGLGCMGMSEFYGPGDDRESIRTIHRALELGMIFLDTADIYGLGRNEELVERAIRDRREKVILATKFGNVLLSNRLVTDIFQSLRCLGDTASFPPLRILVRAAKASRLVPSWALPPPQTEIIFCASSEPPRFPGGTKDPSGAVQIAELMWSP